MINPYQKCRKWHKIENCNDDWVCLSCNKSGHQAKYCDANAFKEGNESKDQENTSVDQSDDNNSDGEDITEEGEGKLAESIEIE